MRNPAAILPAVADDENDLAACPVALAEIERCPQNRVVQHAHIFRRSDIGLRSRTLDWNSVHCRTLRAERSIHHWRAVVAAALQLHLVQYRRQLLSGRGEV